MRTDTRNQDNPDIDVEAFIETVVAPARRGEADQETIRAKAEFSKENRELIRQELSAAGFDVDRLDRFAKEREEKRKKLFEDSRRRAVDLSAIINDRLRDLAPVILPIEPVDTIIDTMTFIRSFIGQGSVSASNVGPMDNWAQYRFDTSSDGLGLPGRLSFFALWQNKRSTPTVIMVKPNLIVNGRLSCEADGGGPWGWFETPQVAVGTVRARTTIWSMQEGVSSIVSDRQLGYAHAASGFLGDDDSDTIDMNLVLNGSGVTIAPNAFALIEVELVTEYATGQLGRTVFDAKDGSRRVDVPQIVLTQLQTPEPPAPPPISLSAGVDTGVTPPRVTLLFSGATGALVDIYQNGVKLGDTENDGVWSFEPGPGTYTYRVCEKLSNVCSMDVTVTVP